MATFTATIPYADTTYADSYFGEKVSKVQWDNASATDREAALKESTRLIDTLNYIGRKAESDQVREFPREGDTEVPVEVVDACCEVALALLRNLDPEEIAAESGRQSERVGDASVTYGARADILAENYGLPSSMAARLLAPWIVDPGEIRIERTS